MRKYMSENKDEACKYLDSLVEGGFTQDGFCKLTHLKPTKNKGYVQVSHNGANKFAVPTSRLSPLGPGQTYCR